jgi:hypothetical protein
MSCPPGGVRGLPPGGLGNGTSPETQERTMSTEIPPTEPTEPVATAPTTGPRPDNQYNDIIAPDLAEDVTAPTGKKTTKPGGVQPNNQYNDSAPKG